jgi:hypothetical protein
MGRNKPNLQYLVGTPGLHRPSVMQAPSSLPVTFVCFGASPTEKRN